MIKGIAFFENRFVNHTVLDLKEISKVGRNIFLHTFSENVMRFNKVAMKKS